MKARIRTASSANDVIFRWEHAPLLESSTMRLDMKSNMKKRRAPSSAFRPAFEQLEGRRLLTVGPLNPNGSQRGLAGLTAADGRVLVMMPHPERLFRAYQNAWRPDDWVEDGAWLRLFRNARVAVG